MAAVELYDPEQNMYFVCSRSGALGVIAETGDAEYKEGETVHRTADIITTGFNAKGFLTAYDCRTGKIAWQKTSRNLATRVR